MSDSQIAQLRSAIDAVDVQIFELIARRLELASRVGEQKRVTDTSITQSKRESQVRSTALRTAATLGIDASVADAIIAQLIDASRRRQLEG